MTRLVESTRMYPPILSPVLFCGLLGLANRYRVLVAVPLFPRPRAVVHSARLSLHVFIRTNYNPILRSLNEFFSRAFGTFRHDVPAVD